MKIMSAKSIRLFITGVTLLVLFAVAIYFYQDTRNNIKISKESRIGAKSYVLSLDYSGLITKSFVKQGDFVRKGDALAYVKSSTLMADLNGKKIVKEDLTFELSENNEVIIQATQNGVIDQVYFLDGSNVAANQTIFKITANQAPFVISGYNLSRDDFQRLKKNSRLQITLPNSSLVDSQIQQITVDDVAMNIGPTVPVTIISAIEPDRNLLIGSPVTATLHLSQQTELERFIKLIKDL